MKRFFLAIAYISTLSIGLHSAPFFNANLFAFGAMSQFLPQWGQQPRWRTALCGLAACELLYYWYQKKARREEAIIRDMERIKNRELFDTSRYGISMYPIPLNRSVETAIRNTPFKFRKTKIAREYANLVLRVLRSVYCENAVQHGILSDNDNDEDQKQIWHNQASLTRTCALNPHTTGFYLAQAGNEAAACDHRISKLVGQPIFEGGHKNGILLLRQYLGHNDPTLKKIEQTVTGFGTSIVLDRIEFIFQHAQHWNINDYATIQPTLQRLYKERETTSDPSNRQFIIKLFARIFKHMVIANPYTDTESIDACYQGLMCLDLFMKKYYAISKNLKCNRTEATYAYRDTDQDVWFKTATSTSVDIMCGFHNSVLDCIQILLNNRTERTRHFEAYHLTDDAIVSMLTRDRDICRSNRDMMGKVAQLEYKKAKERQEKELRQREWEEDLRGKHEEMIKKFTEAMRSYRENITRAQWEAAAQRAQQDRTDKHRCADIRDTVTDLDSFSIKPDTIGESWNNVKQQNDKKRGVHVAILRLLCQEYKVPAPSSLTGQDPSQQELVKAYKRLNMILHTDKRDKTLKKISWSERHTKYQEALKENRKREIAKTEKWLRDVKDKLSGKKLDPNDNEASLITARSQFESDLKALQEELQNISIHKSEYVIKLIVSEDFNRLSYAYELVNLQ